MLGPALLALTERRDALATLVDLAKATNKAEAFSKVKTYSRDRSLGIPHGVHQRPVSCCRAVEKKDR